MELNRISARKETEQTYFFAEQLPAIKAVAD
jgi:hypothetical protein